MLLTTTDYVPDRKVVEVLGIVRGTCVRAKHIGKDLRAAGRTLIGGEMTYYSDLLRESRETAVQRMVEEAEALGADAVVNVRFHTSAVMAGAAEVLAYGTAVRVSS
ncbi:MAG TPA: YbjQ family protein [Thermoplasmata archaeon]|nr:YbjQ family protein [Thermoplasmata archaeon]